MSENIDVLPPEQLLVETPAEAEQPQSQIPALRHILMIVFDYVRHDGTRGTDRVFMENVPDLRVRDQIFHVEKMIVDSSQGQLIRVLITNWKSLEG